MLWQVLKQLWDKSLKCFSVQNASAKWLKCVAKKSWFSLDQSGCVLLVQQYNILGLYLWVAKKGDFSQFVWTVIGCNLPAGEGEEALKPPEDMWNIRSFLFQLFLMVQNNTWRTNDFWMTSSALFFKSFASNNVWGYRVMKIGSHVALRKRNSGAESSRELFKGSKDMASPLVCIQKNFLVRTCRFLVSDVIIGGL